MLAVVLGWPVLVPGIRLIGHVAVSGEHLQHNVQLPLVEGSGVVPPSRHASPVAAIGPHKDDRLAVDAQVGRRREEALEIFEVALDGGW